MTHISSLTLNQYRYGELNPGARGHVEDHLGECAQCKQRYEAQMALRAEFVASPLPPAIQAIQDAPPEPAARLVSAWRRWWMGLAAPLAACAVALFAVLPQGAQDTPEGPAIIDTVRTKGQLPALEAWVSTSDGGGRVLSSDDVLGTGDVIQLMYDTRGASYAVLAGRDGTGEAQVFATLPTDGTGLQTAPFSLTLDPAPGPQRFVLIAADQPPSEAEVRAALQGESTPPAWALTELEFAKE